MSLIGLQTHLQEIGVVVPDGLSLEALSKDAQSYHWTKDQWVLFLGWLANDPAFSALFSGKTLRTFNDSLGIAKHSQSDGFKRFFSTVAAAPIIQLTATKSEEKMLMALSFCPLLESHLSNTCQNAVVAYFDEKLRDLQQLLNGNSEKEIVSAVHTFLSPQRIALLGGLDHQHYRPLTQLVEMVSKLLFHPKMSAGGMLQLLQWLEKLPLQQEHNVQLEGFKRDIKNGKYSFSSSRIPWLRFSLIIGAGLIALGLLLVIFFMPVSKVETTAQEETSYMELTPQERRSIDSLLSTRKEEAKKHVEQALEEDIPVAEGELVMGPVFKNPTFNAIYAAWRKCDTVPFSKTFAAAIPTKQYLPGTLALGTKRGQINATFINEFDLTALVIVFSESAPFNTYSQFVAPNAQLKMQLKPGERLVVVPGSKIKKQLPAKALPYEQVDDRFFEQLENIFEVKKVSGPLKLVYKAAGREVYLVDLNSGLELP